VEWGFPRDWLTYPCQESAGGKPSLAWGQVPSLRANQAGLLMGVLAYNLLHMLRLFYLVGEEVKRSMECLIKRLIKGVRTLKMPIPLHNSG